MLRLTPISTANGLVISGSNENGISRNHFLHSASDLGIRKLDKLAGIDKGNVMDKKQTVNDTLNKIKERDADVRISAEQELLHEAASLTNGKTGCSVTQGKVLLGVATKLIEISSNTREIIAILPTLQTKQECQEAQKKHVRGFNLSTNITIITTSGFVLGFFGKLIGWW